MSTVLFHAIKKTVKVSYEYFKHPFLMSLFISIFNIIFCLDKRQKFQWFIFSAYSLCHKSRKDVAKQSLNCHNHKSQTKKIKKHFLLSFFCQETMSTFHHAFTAVFFIHQRNGDKIFLWWEKKWWKNFIMKKMSRDIFMAAKEKGWRLIELKHDLEGGKGGHFH
jgi:hypothetical protein